MRGLILVGAGLAAGMVLAQADPRDERVLLARNDDASDS